MGKIHFSVSSKKISDTIPDHVEDGEIYAELRIPVRALALLIAMHMPQQTNAQPSTVVDDEDVTPQEAASILRKSISTIYRRTRSGELPSHRLGEQTHGPIFIRRSDLQKLKKTRDLNRVNF
jgi:excisionase family DNA binding protein